MSRSKAVIDQVERPASSGGSLDGSPRVPFDTRVSYALGVLLGLGGPVQTWPEWLRYGPVEAGSGFSGLHIQASGFFDPGVYGTARSLPKLPLDSIEGVPLLFGKGRVEPRGSGLIVHADILASAYFLLTRYEEWIRSEVRDLHGRFPGRESLPYRAGFISCPVVDEYAGLLRKWAREIGVEIGERRSRFTVWLTHDIDTLGPVRPGAALRASVRTALRGAEPLAAWREFASALRLRPHPYNNIHEVLKLDDILCAHAEPGRCRRLFFFMARNGGEYDRAQYVGSRIAAKAVRDVLAAGAEVGLHASYEAGRHPSGIAAERLALETIAGRTIDKNRHHYLAWREPGDGRRIAQAGIRWDSTLGYADVAGFRLGTCHPLELFDPEEQRLIGIEEHPLAVMEATLEWDRYMGLSRDAAMEHTWELAKAAKRMEGELVLLWHNTSLSSTVRGWQREFYIELLTRLRDLLR